MDGARIAWSMIGVLSERATRSFLPGVRALRHHSRKLTLHGFRDLPVGVDIETDARCNRSCSYCPRPKETHQLSDATFDRVIQELKDWSFRGAVCPNAYNEPLLDSRIYGFVSHVKKELPDSPVYLFTNSDLLVADGSLERLLEAGVHGVFASIHEPSPASLAERVYKLARNHRCVSVRDMRGGHRTFALNSRGGTVDVGCKQLIGMCTQCDVMVVRADGAVPLCKHDARKDHVLGSIHTSSLQEIWQRSAALRRELYRGHKVLHLCRNCGEEALAPAALPG